METCAYGCLTCVLLLAILWNHQDRISWLGYQIFNLVLQSELIVGDQTGAIHMWDLRTDHNEQLVGYISKFLFSFQGNHSNMVSVSFQYGRAIRII